MYKFHESKTVSIRDEKRDIGLQDESKEYESKEYDFDNEDDRNRACSEYSRCQQNCLSSSAEQKMRELDTMAEGAGLKFQMMNEAAYRQPSALVKPRYEMVQMAVEQDFAAAVASIPADTEQLGK